MDKISKEDKKEIFELVGSVLCEKINEAYAIYDNGDGREPGRLVYELDAAFFKYIVCPAEKHKVNLSASLQEIKQSISTTLRNNREYAKSLMENGYFLPETFSDYEKARQVIEFIDPEDFLTTYFFKKRDASENIKAKSFEKEVFPGIANPNWDVRIQCSLVDGRWDARIANTLENTTMTDFYQKSTEIQSLVRAPDVQIKLNEIYPLARDNATNLQAREKARYLQVRENARKLRREN